jgi:protein-disulfide isomerase
MSMKSVFDRLGTVTAATTAMCATAAMITAGVVYGRGRGAPPRAGGIEIVSDWKTYSGTGHRAGAADAPVVITEFVDFQCRYCRRLAKSIREIQQTHGSQVAVVVRHFPLDRKHPSARAAAMASECAAAVGRFAEFEDVLYKNQRAIGRVPWSKFADRAGVRDTLSFTRCVNDSTYAATVGADIAAGRRLHVTGTPTVLVNQWRLRGPATPEALDRLLRQALTR